MILLQQVVVADTKYTVANQSNLVVFDVHNDSPYNMGVSFGRDTGIGNADYYTSAHSILYGIGPLAVAQRSVGGVKWTGTIYIYTQTPLGGGSTNLSSAPASQITVIGYSAGYNPSGTTSLSRMNNIGNPVSTNVASTNSILNTGNPPLTNIISATPSDAASATWTADNSGNLTVKSDNAGTLTTLLQLIAGASPAVKLAAAAVLTEALGNLKVDGTLESVGAATCDSTLAVTGTLTANGQVTLGNANGIIGGTNMLLGKSAAGDILDAGTTLDTYLKSANNIRLQIAGSTQATINSNGIQSTNGGYYGTDGSNTIIAATGTSGTGNVRIQNTDLVSVQVPGGSTQLSVTNTNTNVSNAFATLGNCTLTSTKTNRISNNNICAASHFSATFSTTATVNHNFSNTTPNFVQIICSTASSSATVGATGMTSTQVNLVNGSGSSLSFSGIATAV